MTTPSDWRLVEKLYMLSDLPSSLRIEVLGDRGETLYIRCKSEQEANSICFQFNAAIARILRSNPCLSIRQARYQWDEGCYFTIPLVLPRKAVRKSLRRDPP